MKEFKAFVCTDMIYCPECETRLVAGINCPDHGLVGLEVVDLEY